LLIDLQSEPEVPESEVVASEDMGPEVIGLLSLMLLQESRHAARTSPTGELILLETQDRSLWNREQIAEGLALLQKALKSQRFGSYTLQARSRPFMRRRNRPPCALP
jgi:predicted RNA polymerase sigma factor